MARKTKQPRGKKMNPTFFVFCEGKRAMAKQPYSNPSSTVHLLTNEILRNVREQ